MLIKRFAGPIITQGMLDGLDGQNINGPSLIALPDWLPDRLGRYYLYFASHDGQYIRLAFADSLEGPWQVYRPGSLHLDDLPLKMDHIASPDVHVDHERRQIRMYFHGCIAGEKAQHSYIAVSTDGLNFSSNVEPVADFYLRALPWRGQWVGMSKGGVMYRSDTGLQAFVRLPVPAFPMRDVHANAPGDIRHVALELDGDRLWVYYTRTGDSPERILRAHINLDEPDDRWLAREQKLILKPETPWEGAAIPLTKSSAGAAHQPENALRDPAIFLENGRRFLLYAVAGEAGIAIAEIVGSQVKGEAKTGRDALRSELLQLALPGALDARLNKIDAGHALQRIFVMGCGRSGTWLLLSLFSTFEDVTIIPEEVPVESFGVVRPNKPVLVMKRDFRSYERIEQIPERIKIAWIVRHPFDVLTSQHPVTERKYHIQPYRWLGEMLALQYLVDSNRADTWIVRYEDLVTYPESVQTKLSQAFGLKILSTVDQIPSRFKASPMANAAMHGLRAIDSNSVHKYKNDPEKVAYLKTLLPRLGRTLEWVANEYSYNLDL
jgi:hypothetical protein